MKARTFQLQKVWEIKCGKTCGWMDLLVGAGVSTALRIVQWSKPFLTPTQPLRSGWLFQRKTPPTATTSGVSAMEKL